MRGGHGLDCADLTINGVETAERSRKLEWMKTTGAPHAETGQKATDPVTEDVRAARTLAANPVTAIRIVGVNVELPMPLAKAQFTLGRADAAEVDLPIARGDVSRLHCVLRRNGSELLVTDAGSTNGTRVRGQAAPGSFRAGERIQVGSTDLIALDDAMQVLRRTLLRYLGFEAHRVADDTLTMLATLDHSDRDGKAILLVAPRGSEPDVLARAIHDGSGRRRRGFATVSATASDRDTTAGLKSGSNGTVLVDLSGVGRGEARHSLVAALSGNTYRTRPILVAPSDHVAQAATAPVRLLWERIEVPAIKDRSIDVPHLLNAMMVELGSQRRIEELPTDRVAALSEYEWPDNHTDLRFSAERLQCFLANDCNVSAAARALRTPIKPASLNEYLGRIGVLAPRRR